MLTEVERQCDSAANPCLGHKRPRLILLISCGWAVRNYIRSAFLSTIRKDADVIVVVTTGGGELESFLSQAGIRVKTLVKYQLPHRFTALNGLLNGAHHRRLGLWNPLHWKWMVSLNPPFKRPYYEFQKVLSKL